MYVEIVRIDSDNKISSPFSLHPSLTIEEILRIIFKNFGEDYDTIKLDTHNLLDPELKNKSFFELGIQHDCKILLFPSTNGLTQGLRGGGEKYKKCPSCFNFYNYRDVCEHDHCSNCRKLDPPPCECCFHNRRGGRCKHGWCWKSCVHAKKRKSKCDCHINFPNSNSNDCRDRSDYNFRKTTTIKKSPFPDLNIDPSDLNTNIPLHLEFPEVKKFRPYPINDYGNREAYSTLSDHQWLTFQCLLFFHNCEIQNITPKASTTFTFFIKNYNLDEQFPMESVERVLMLYLTNQISINKEL